MLLGRWASWGAIPNVFADDPGEWSDIADQLKELLSDEEWSAARRTTINAHYTASPVVLPIWRFLERVGVTGGTVLEPGCGSGNFLGFAPRELDANFNWIGVELDPITAQIARHLYPGADIRNEGFETTRLANGSVDLVVGNVPFGKVALTDPIHNATRESIHNHFILKSLNLLRPGGYLAVITSRYTLDARSPAARQAMADLADLEFAARLPSATHHEVAGTTAVTDMLILRRRPDGQTPSHVGQWAELATIDTVDGPTDVNEYFASRPELICGTPRLGGQYGRDTLKVDGRLNGHEFGGLIQAAADAAVARGHQHAPVAAVVVEPVVRRTVDMSGEVDTSGLKPGSLVALSSGFGRLIDGDVDALDVPASAQRELRGLCGLRDLLGELLDVQADAASDHDVSRLQADLNSIYDSYVSRYGPLNRFTWARTGRIHPETGEEVMRRNRPRMGGFRDDPDAPSVFALEDFDPVAQTATKAAVFSQRLLTPRTTVTSTSDPDEAVLLCLDQVGHVDLDVVAGLLHIDADTARTRLGTKVFNDPEHPERLIPAAEYRSGNVRSKLAAASAAAEVDDRYTVNVAALAEVLPLDLAPAEIDVRPGQPWIPVDVMEAFIGQELEARDMTVRHDPITAVWDIKVPSWQCGTVTMTSTWGTGRKSAIDLLRAASNNTTVSVYDTVDDTRVLNQGATIDAREKQQQLVKRFGAWMWQDPARADRLKRIYNDLFNAHVSCVYDGAHLSFPGLVETFTPRDHQRAAVARILAEPTTLLAHEVGAGKTATMVIAAMELKRLGMVKKPMVVVPNHMQEQFCTEWRALYPTAKVLFPTSVEQGPAGRKNFVARAAVGEWDAVVVTESVFERIPLEPATEARFIDSQVADLRRAQTNLRGDGSGSSRTVKDIELRVLRLEEKSKNLLARSAKDDGATFEQTGVDYLFVDEAHHAKNLAITTKLQGQGKKGSGYASQLDIRLQWLRETHGPKVLTMATATPIANSLSEMWVMQHYARPDILEAAGVGPFDAWAANFAEQITRLELAPEGTHYRIATRLAKYRNVPDLISMFTAFADVKTKDDLDLAVPAIRNGHPEIVVVPGDSQLHNYVADLGTRAEAVRNGQVDPTEDNMLKISGDGRAAALDIRLVGLPEPLGATKAGVAARRIHGIWGQNRDTVFNDPAGSAHSRPGALQLVFAELGTPGGKKWGMYEQLRSELVALGVPRDQVRFIHEAKNAREKEQLFNDARSGNVAVLVGTTEKMGVGTNVQARCAALHHLDCPWRPADVEQREGRIIRQGNQNDTVDVVRYVTAGSFDVYMWQTVELKSGFINQVLSGRHGGRNIDDVASDQELSYAQVKALATGDDRIVRKAGLDADVARLSRARSAHNADQASLQGTVTRGVETRNRLNTRISTLTGLAATRTDTRGDQFVATVDGNTFRDRSDAGQAALVVIDSAMRNARLGIGTQRTAFTVGNIDMEIRAWIGAPDRVEINIDRTGLRIDIMRDDIGNIDPSKLSVRLENLTYKIAGAHSDSVDELTATEADIVKAQQRLGGVFAHQAQLDTAVTELAALNAELAADGNAQEPDSGSDRATVPGLGR